MPDCDALGSYLVFPVIVDYNLELEARETLSSLSCFLVRVFFTVTEIKPGWARVEWEGDNGRGERKIYSSIF